MPNQKENDQLFQFVFYGKNFRKDYSFLSVIENKQIGRPYIFNPDFLVKIFVKDCPPQNRHTHRGSKRRGAYIGRWSAGGT